MVSDCDIKPAYGKKKPCNVFLFSKADLAKMLENMSTLAQEFLSTHTGQSVDENWTCLRIHIAQTMTSHIPVKMTSKGPCDWSLCN